MGREPARGAGQEICKKFAGRVGSGQEVFKYHGSGRVTLIRSDP